MVGLSVQSSGSLSIRFMQPEKYSGTELIARMVLAEPCEVKKIVCVQENRKLRMPLRSKV